MRRAALMLAGALGLVSMVVVARPAGAAIKVACVGDSITAGSGTTGGNNYPTVLGRTLGAAYQVGNFGVSATTMMKAPAASSYWTQAAFSASKAFAPEVVVIMLGTNDSKATVWKGGNNGFEVDYHAMIAELAALPSRPAIYAVLPPPALSGNFNISGPVLANQILPLIAKVAAAARVPVIDVNAAFNPDPRRYFGAGNGQDIGDGIHPNNTGAAAIARVVAEALILAPSGADAGGADSASDGRQIADAGDDGAVAADPGGMGGSGGATGLGGTGGAGTGGAGTGAMTGTGGAGAGASTSDARGAGAQTPRADGGCGCALGAQPRPQPQSFAPLGLVVYLGLRHVAARTRRRRSSSPSSDQSPG